MNLIFTLVLITMAIALGACSDAEQASITRSESPAANNDDSIMEAALVEATDPQATAKFEQSLLGITERITDKQNSTIENQSVQELEQLSAEDRAALREIAAVDLMESAENKASLDAQAEAENRGPAQSVDD